MRIPFQNIKNYEKSFSELWIIMKIMKKLQIFFQIVDFGKNLARHNLWQWAVNACDDWNDDGSRRELGMKLWWGGGQNLQNQYYVIHICECSLTSVLTSVILLVRAWEIESHVSVRPKSPTPRGREFKFQFTI